VLQEVEIKSADNIFLEPYGTSQIVKRVLQMTNIVLPQDLIMLPRPYTRPGTYSLPLALLDDAGQQISLTLQLTPKQASAEELKKQSEDSG
jgi:hypothetical protein